MNNEDKGYTIYCSRCGAEMNSNSRYCMKCGNLNTDHEANESMKPYIKDNENSYQVGSGSFINNNELQTSIGNNTGNKKLCFIVNFSIYMIMIIISFLISINKGFDILLIRNSMFPMASIIISISFIYIYSIELICMKCNKPWWSGLIPIYNMFVLCEILYHKKWLGILTLIPIIGQIFILVMFYKLGKSFKFNGILTALLSFIYIPVIGFGTSLFNERSYVDNFSQKEIENDYKRKKVFLFFLILFILIGAGLLLWKNIGGVEEGSELIGDAYYVYASERIVKKTKKIISSNNFTCRNGAYYENTGVYYFKYQDLGDFIYLPLYYQREPIRGYVKVDNTTGVSRYFVSITDGKLGISEDLIDNINIDSVSEFNELNPLNNDYDNICTPK